MARRYETGVLESLLDAIHRDLPILNEPGTAADRLGDVHPDASAVPAAKRGPGCQDSAGRTYRKRICMHVEAESQFLSRPNVLANPIGGAAPRNEYSAVARNRRYG